MARIRAEDKEKKDAKKEELKVRIDDTEIRVNPESIGGKFMRQLEDAYLETWARRRGIPKEELEKEFDKEHLRRWSYGIARAWLKPEAFDEFPVLSNITNTIYNIRSRVRERLLGRRGYIAPSKYPSVRDQLLVGGALVGMARRQIEEMRRRLGHAVERTQQDEEIEVEDEKVCEAMDETINFTDLPESAKNYILSISEYLLKNGTAHTLDEIVSSEPVRKYLEKMGIKKRVRLL